MAAAGRTGRGMAVRLLLGSAGLLPEEEGQAVGEIQGAQVKEDGQGATNQMQVVRVAQSGPKGLQQRGD